MLHAPFLLSSSPFWGEYHSLIYQTPEYFFSLVNLPNLIVIPIKIKSLIMVRNLVGL